MPSRTSVHTERAFETAIEDHLLAHGWQRGDPLAFDRKRALFPAELLAFIQATQPKAWSARADYHGAQAGDALLDDLVKAIAASGLLQVLRHGFNCFGKSFKLAFFAPASGLNPELQAQYAANRLTVTRQVHYSEQHENSLDMVLALNGLPLATAELKNQFTGQTVHDAMRQYRQDRDAQETVFAFNRRALVHFAVDPDLVFMTTRLEGAATTFLPFNQGHAGGAGNPPHPAGHRTAYLWQEAWARDSWLDILGRFVQLEKTSKEVLVRRKGQQVKQKIVKEALIFPRWHQLSAVRASRQRGARARPGPAVPGAALGRQRQEQHHRLAGAPAVEPARRPGRAGVRFGHRHHRPPRARPPVAGQRVRLRAQAGRGGEDRRGLDAARAGAGRSHADHRHHAAEIPLRHRQDGRVAERSATR